MLIENALCKEQNEQGCDIANLNILLKVRPHF
jgi:hypothetical protein